MLATITFAIPDDPEEAETVRSRLDEAIDLVNMDKQEQAIEGELFSGNPKDYKGLDWLHNAFENEILIAELRDFLGYEEDDLTDWDFDDWYEDLVVCESFNYRLQPSDEPNRWALSFEVSSAEYGSDNAHALLLLAAGAFALDKLEVVLQPGEEPAEHKKN